MTGLFLVFMLIASVRPGVSDTSTPPLGAKKENLQDQIAEAIEQLGHPKYHVREKATKFLWSVGEAAAPALRRALKSDDPEVVHRARSILERFNYGIFPDTPKEIVQLAEQYRDGAPAAKRSAVQKLLEVGPEAYPTLLAISTSEADAGLRQEILRQLRPHVTKMVPILLAGGKPAEAEAMLQLAAGTGSDSSIRDYAAYLLLTGRLDEHIRQLVAQGPASAHAAKSLVYFHRARGDLEKAREAAEKAGDERLLRSILLELGDWRGLAKPTGTNEFATDIEALGFQAAYHRLAGDKDGFKKAVAEIKALAGKGRKDLNAWFAAEALLINDRPREAVDVLIANRQYGQAFELLSVRLEFSEALELVEKGRSEKVKDLFSLELALARSLGSLGEKERAGEILSRLIAEQQQDPYHLAKVMEVEHALHLEEQALRHCAAALAGTDDSQVSSRLLSWLFPERPTQRDVWWRTFRRSFPDEPHEVTLKRLGELMQGKTAREKLAALAEQAEAAAAELPRKEEAEWLRAVGQTLQAAGAEQLALKYFEKAASVSGSSAHWTCLGDFLAGKKRWKEAAGHYGSARQADAGQSVPVYLQGWALAQAGREAEGKRLMKLALLLPLADEAERHKLADALDEHGLSAEAHRQRQLILRTGRFTSWYLDNCLDHLGRRALAEKDYSRAAECFERCRLDCLRTSTAFASVRGYLVLAARVHSARAREHLAKGQIDKALEAARTSVAALPGSIGVVLELVPELDKLGRGEQADQLFAESFGRLEDVCRRYPRGPGHHNNAAWLAARCGRRLDRAVAYAARAVELDPDNPAYIDTLAEAHFRRGEREEAVRLMVKCVRLDPDNPWFQQQLKRFRSAAATQEAPAEAPGR